ncbi:hypothetical protein K1W54_21735 [Micromonospora sp. CPCC 205371]|nr:hypothetical protein [Micromonospora sp. CPCC 205371]
MTGLRVVLTDKDVLLRHGLASATVSLDGFIADESDRVGPLFDWYNNGEVPFDGGDPERVFHVSARAPRIWRKPGRGTSSNGMVERDFTVGVVPGVLWSPASRATDYAPLVLGEAVAVVPGMAHTVLSVDWWTWCSIRRACRPKERGGEHLCHEGEPVVAASACGLVGAGGSCRLWRVEVAHGGIGR